jgi:hypothetical protein
MNISEELNARIQEFINEYCYDGLVLLKDDGNSYEVYDTDYPEGYRNLWKKMYTLITSWAEDNEDELCQNPVFLMDYCLTSHSFGGIMTIWFKPHCYDDFELVNF